MYTNWSTSLVVKSSGGRPLVRDRENGTWERRPIPSSGSIQTDDDDD